MNNRIDNCCYWYLVLYPVIDWLKIVYLTNSINVLQGQFRWILFLFDFYAPCCSFIIVFFFQLSRHSYLVQYFSWLRRKRYHYECHKPIKPIHLSIFDLFVTCKFVVEIDTSPCYRPMKLSIARGSSSTLWTLKFWLGLHDGGVWGMFQC